MFLGDVGGLQGILEVLGGLLVGFFSNFAAYNYIMRMMYFVRAREDTPVSGLSESKSPKSDIKNTIVKDF